METKRRSPTDKQPRSTWGVNLRLTEDQRRQIVREATEKGVSISDVLRTRIFRRRGAIVFEAEAVKERFLALRFMRSTWLFDPKRR